MLKAFLSIKVVALKILILVCAMLITCAASVAQMPELDWVKTLGGKDAEFIRATKFDPQGNIINLGSFRDSVDFDPGQGQHFMYSDPNTTGIFIQKLDAGGNFIWARSITASDPVTSRDLEIGSDGSIYATGVFYGHIVDFNPDPNQVEYINGSVNAHSMYLLKLDPQGDFEWAQVQSGVTASTFLEIDTAGNLYQIGTFNNVMDKSPDRTIFDSIQPQVVGKDDFFIQKLDSTGNQLWFKTISGLDTVQAHALKVNQQGEVVVAGFFKGQVDFDPGAASFNLTSGNSGSASSGFLMWLTPAGNLKNVVALQGNGNTKIIEVEMDYSGNLLIAGTYSGQVDFDPGTGVSNTNSSNAEGYFIEKFNNNGNMVWEHHYENSLDYMENYSLHVVMTKPNSIFVGGAFYGPDLKLEPGKVNGRTLTNAQNRDMFLVRHDSTGAVKWGYGYGGAGADVIFDLFTDGQFLYYSGYFMYNISFDPHNPANITYSNGSFDAFILKLKGCLPVTSEVHFDWEKASLSWDYSNAYPTPYKLSWYSCDNDSIISSGTDTTFFPTQNGNYALIVAVGACSDTSSCFSVHNVGLEEEGVATNIGLYPNPTDGTLHIAGLGGQQARISVNDLSGRTVAKASSQSFVDLSKVKPGTYFVVIEMDGVFEVRKVIRKP